MERQGREIGCIEEVAFRMHLITSEHLRSIARSESGEYGVYHYSNEGVTSWYDLAKAIFEIVDVRIEVNPLHTEAYPTPAKRPAYSVMDKRKIKEKLDIRIPYWGDSLKNCVRIKVSK